MSFRDQVKTYHDGAFFQKAVLPVANFCAALVFAIFGFIGALLVGRDKSK